MKKFVRRAHRRPGTPNDQLCLEQLKEEIDWFNHDNFLRLCPNEHLEGEVHRMSHGLGSMVYDVSSQSIPLLRCRKIADGSDKYRKLSQVLAPPPDRVSNFQRCNVVNQSILYCSSNLSTALSEVNAQPGERYQVTSLKLKNGEELRTKFIGLFDYIRRFESPPPTNVFTGDIDTLAGIYNDFRESSTSELWLKTLLFDAFLADWFSREVDGRYENGFDYALTAYYANMCFTNNKMQAVLYPSVKNKGGWNFAILPEMVPSKVGVIEAILGILNFPKKILTFYRG